LIRVTQAAEPATFQHLVRSKGTHFLNTHPRPTSKEWSKHSYWRKVLPDLYSAFGGICAYSCHWIPYDTGADTVEHFRPKDRYPAQAYEWDNYRLVCATLNGRKGIQEDVLDPFLVEDGWFVLDFPSLLIKPAPQLPEADRQRVQTTIVRLRLNDEGTCLKSRVKWLRDFCSRDISLEYLRRHAPFIVMELERQGLVTEIFNVFIT
jgi:hypothetical protein